MWSGRDCVGSPKTWVDEDPHARCLGDPATNRRPPKSGDVVSRAVGKTDTVVSYELGLLYADSAPEVSRNFPLLRVV